MGPRHASTRRPRPPGDPRADGDRSRVGRLPAVPHHRPAVLQLLHPLPRRLGRRRPRARRSHRPAHPHRHRHHGRHPRNTTVDRPHPRPVQRHPPGPCPTVDHPCGHRPRRRAPSEVGDRDRPPPRSCRRRPSRAHRPVRVRSRTDRSQRPAGASRRPRTTGHMGSGGVARPRALASTGPTTAVSPLPSVPTPDSTPPPPPPR